MLINQPNLPPRPTGCRMFPDCWVPIFLPQRMIFALYSTPFINHCPVNGSPGETLAFAKPLIEKKVRNNIEQKRQKTNTKSKPKKGLKTSSNKNQKTVTEIIKKTTFLLIWRLETILNMQISFFCFYLSNSQLRKASCRLTGDKTMSKSTKRLQKRYKERLQKRSKEVHR